MGHLSVIMLLLYAFPISMNILLELHYLPCIQFFSKFHGFEIIIIDDTEAFEKQSYRNRCTIAGANGPIDLIVPVHSSRRRLPVKEIEIDNHTNWQHQHWQSIKSVYGKTAFYEHYAYKFETAYTNQCDRLFDFNMDLLMIILKILKIDSNRLKLLSENAVLFPSESLAEDSEALLSRKSSESPSTIADPGSLYKGDSEGKTKILKIDSNRLKLLSENAGSEYLDFKNKIHPKAKFKVIDPGFQPIIYQQAFTERHGFIPNLSILDLIFNEGPETERILRGSAFV